MPEIFINPPMEHQERPNLQGKKVLIVGGTHGIGASLATKCVTLGAEVAAIGKTKNSALACNQIIHDVVADPLSIEQHYIGAHYVLNNIGKYEKNRIVDTSLDRLDEIIAYNLRTMFILAQFSIRHALNVVVNMSSRPTLDNYANWSLYTLTKQGVITITQAAAAEAQAPQKHYALCPSRVDTKFRDILFPNENRATRLSPEETAEIVLQLFNGLNPSGSYYWIKKLIESDRS